MHRSNYRVVPEPLDPADEMGGDSLEGGDVDRPVEVEVGPGLRGGVGGLEDQVVGGVVHPREGADLTNQGLQRATYEDDKILSRNCSF